MRYNPNKIERRWQRIWKKAEIYKISNRARKKKNFYHLVMFPYPSGDLHIGHWYNFAPADVYARFKRIQGFNVMSPIGFDGFGLPAENAAIKHGIHPKTWTYKNIKRMRKQLKSIGAIYDWGREIITCEPEYYKWTQWMFLQLYKKGLAYRDKVPANWCPSCKTVLANEQVVEGRCERCDSRVLQREIEQWLFRISAFSEDLLKDLEALDWPETTKMMQKNWIGRSEGWEIEFGIMNQESGIRVFTTRTDTLFGCTYLVIALEHPLTEELKSQIINHKHVKQYIEESKKKTERERISELKEKTGIEIKGIKAINPVNGREIPIFVADYVLMHYGAGAIMAVPAHDQRDFDFAKSYNLPIREVIAPQSNTESPSSFRGGGGEAEQRGSMVVSTLGKAYEGEGFLINSGRFTGMASREARERIGEQLIKKGLAEKKVYYRLRDWIISRQRYWGAPIPLVFCENCALKIKNQKSRLRQGFGGQAKIKNKKLNNGELLNPGWIAVSEKDLPVVLPRIRNYQPTEEGKSPLAKSKKFTDTFCPKCKSPVQRETDTMDTFVCSSWYFLRYADPQNEKKFASKKKLKMWLPVNMYIGGAEHAVMHLLYSRFFTKALKKMNRVHFFEPFLSLRHQGIILGENQQKMSKSRGNVVDPDRQIKKYGSDVVRMYLCFMGPYEQGGPWNPKGIIGISRFLQRVWDLVTNPKSKIQNPKSKIKNQKIENKKIEKLLHKTIKKVTEDIENFRFNTAISALMILVNQITTDNKQLTIDNLKTLLLLLAPFAPHLTEELWQKHILKVQSSKFKARTSIHNQSWPKYNPKLMKEEIIQFIIQINGRVRDRMELRADISKERAKELVLKREKVKKWIEGKEIQKIIFVPGKLINVVV